MRRKALGLAALVAALASPGDACMLQMGLGDPISTSDPLTIPVLVAARGAAAEGRIGWFSSTDAEAVREVIHFLSFLPRVVDGEAVKGADGAAAFSVVQTQTGYWTRYHAAADGALAAEGHRAGPEAGDDVIAVSDSALIAILRGRLDVESAREFGLIRGRGASAEASLQAFAGIVDAFAASSFGKRVRSVRLASIDGD